MSLFYGLTEIWYASLFQTGQASNSSTKKSVWLSKEHCILFSSPTMPTHPKGSNFTYQQFHLAQQLAHSNQHAINQDINSVFGYIENEARWLSYKHKQSVAWFQHQFYQGYHVVCQKHATSVFNATKQIPAFLEGHKGGMWFYGSLIQHMGANNT